MCDFPETNKTGFCTNVSCKNFERNKPESTCPKCEEYTLTTIENDDTACNLQNCVNIGGGTDPCSSEICSYKGPVCTETVCPYEKRIDLRTLCINADRKPCKVDSGDLKCLTDDQSAKIDKDILKRFQYIDFTKHTFNKSKYLPKTYLPGDGADFMHGYGTKPITDEPGGGPCGTRACPLASENIPAYCVSNAQYDFPPCFPTPSSCHPAPQPCYPAPQPCYPAPPPCVSAPPPCFPSPPPFCPPTQRSTCGAPDCFIEKLDPKYIYEDATELCWTLDCSLQSKQPCETPVCQYAPEPCCNPQCPYTLKKPCGAPICPSEPDPCWIPPCPYTPKQLCGTPVCPSEPEPCWSPPCPCAPKKLRGTATSSYAADPESCGAPNCPYGNKKEPCGASDCPYGKKIEACGVPDLPYEKKKESCGAPNCPYGSKKEPCERQLAVKKEPCGAPDCPYRSKNPCGAPNCKYANTIKEKEAKKKKPRRHSQGDIDSNTSCDSGICPFANMKKTEDEESDKISCDNLECPFQQKKECDDKSCPFVKEYVICCECGGVLSDLCDDSIKLTSNIDVLQAKDVSARTIPVEQISEVKTTDTPRSSKTSAKQNKPEITSKDKQKTVMQPAATKTTQVKGPPEVLYTYPGVRIGHKTCMRRRHNNVPNNMGWLWTAKPWPGNPELWRGYKPGAVPITIHKMIRNHRRALGIYDPSEMIRKKKSKTSSKARSDDAKKRCVEIKKKDGCYIVTVNPVKDPKTLDAFESPYMDCTPMQFKILKPAKSPKEKLDENDCLCDEVVDSGMESDSDNSELEFNFSPPAALTNLHPRKKKNYNTIDTQYNKKDAGLLRSSLSKKKPKKKKKKKK